MEQLTQRKWICWAVFEGGLRKRDLPGFRGFRSLGCAGLCRSVHSHAHGAKALPTDSSSAKQPINLTVYLSIPTSDAQDLLETTFIFIF